MPENRKRVTILTLFGIKDVNDHATVLKKLSEGFDVNTVDSGGRTLLMEAAIRKDHELIKLLLINGANVNVRDKRSWTALHFAAQEDDLLATKMLVEARADVSAQDDYGNNVVLRAVSMFRGNGDVIQFLIAHGADVNVKNKSGISALDSAKQTSNYNVLPFMDI